MKHFEKYNLAEPVCEQRHDGAVVWHVRGRLHRVSGPAVVYPNGAYQWWHSGFLHRADGPAVGYYDGRVDWWLWGEYCHSMQSWMAENRELSSKQKTAILLQWG